MAKKTKKIDCSLIVIAACLFVGEDRPTYEWRIEYEYCRRQYDMSHWGAYASKAGAVRAAREFAERHGLRIVEGA